LIVHEYSELAVVAFDQFDLKAEFAPEHSRRPGGLDARQSVTAASMVNRIVPLCFLSATCGASVSVSS
jgi:hypothetical protein